MLRKTIIRYKISKFDELFSIIQRSLSRKLYIKYLCRHILLYCGFREITFDISIEMINNFEWFNPKYKLVIMYTKDNKHDNIIAFEYEDYYVNVHHFTYRNISPYGWIFTECTCTKEKTSSYSNCPKFSHTDDDIIPFILNYDSSLFQLYVHYVKNNLDKYSSEEINCLPYDIKKHLRF